MRKDDVGAGCLCQTNRQLCGRITLMLHIVGARQQCPGADSRIDFLDAPDQRVDKRRDHDLLDQSAFFDQTHRFVHQTPREALELDLHLISVGHEVQCLVEQRDSLRAGAFAEMRSGVQASKVGQVKLIHRARPIGRPVDEAVVDHDRVAVAAQMDVELDAVRSQLEGTVETRQRVFRAPGAARRDDRC